MVEETAAVGAIQTPEERGAIAKAMRGRIMNVLPAATYQMDRFLQLGDVVVSDRTETACVEVGPQPRLHLNKDFVEEYCQRDEHLLMLVMHELYHIILGHTRLFPRLTEAHNIAFDAVINSMLCHQFPEDSYVSFFRQINPSPEFPGRLLCPPEGWPDNPVELSPPVSAKEEKVMRLLYGKRPATVTYHEILELFQNLMPPRHGRGDRAASGDNTSGQCTKQDDFTLLGDHGGSEGSGQEDEMAVKDSLLKNILRRVTENWPAQANPATDRGKGGRIFDFLMPKPKSPRAQFLEALKHLLGKAGVLRPEPGTPYGWSRMTCAQDFTTVLPNLRDRHAHSREALLGEMPVLYRGSIDQSRLRWTPQHVAHVYIDVSGSMNDALPWMAAALDPLHRRGHCRLYAFSTIVDEVRRGNLAKGRIKNTFGTDINCVYEHLLKLPARRVPNRVVVLTDGYTGAPRQAYAEGLKMRRTKLFVGLVAPADDSALRPYAHTIERLPSPKPE